MAEHLHQTDRFRNAEFLECDVSGSTFRDCDFRHVRVIDSYVSDVSLSGEVARVVVNDVDVTSYVESELDRIHPLRVTVRNATDPGSIRSAWAAVESEWADTIDRARSGPASVVHERVDDEWSLVETLRHLIFATDAWIGRAVLGRAQPYHPMGLPNDGYPPRDAIAIGLDPDAEPTLDEVLAVRSERLEMVREVVDSMTTTELARLTHVLPAPGYPATPRPVGACVRCILREESEHLRYARRDLARLVPADTRVSPGQPESPRS